MRMNLKNLLWLLAAVICFASCSKEDIIEKVTEIPEGKILVDTEIVIDGVVQSDTRAVSEAGYTTGDGLYDKGDPVTVAAFANEGYELVTFYDKKAASINLGSSYDFPAEEPRTFKAEFARKYTITVSANPTAGGTVAGGGTYRGGKTCTLTATANAGYVFDGWYEGSTKVSSDTNYSFIVSSNRTITGKFELIKFIAVGRNGYIISPTKTQQVGTNDWNAITYANGKYVVVGDRGSFAYSIDGITWTKASIPGTDSSTSLNSITYGNGRFVVVGDDGNAWTYLNSNWTKSSNRPEGSMYLVSVIYANGKFIASSNGGTLVSSTDGVNWSKFGNIRTNTVKSLVYDNGKYVAVGDMGYVAYSTNGTSWSTLQINGGSFNLKSVTYGNGRFVVVGTRRYLAYSTDGASWTPASISGNSFTLYSAAYLSTSGKFVAVGELGWIINSNNGIDWSTPSRQKDQNGKDVTVDLYDVCIME